MSDTFQDEYNFVVRIPVYIDSEQWHTILNNASSDFEPVNILLDEDITPQYWLDCDDAEVYTFADRFEVESFLNAKDEEDPLTMDNEIDPNVPTINFYFGYIATKLSTLENDDLGREILWEENKDEDVDENNPLYAVEEIIDLVPVFAYFVGDDDITAEFHPTFNYNDIDSIGIMSYSELF